MVASLLSAYTPIIRAGTRLSSAISSRTRLKSLLSPAACAGGFVDFGRLRVAHSARELAICTGFAQKGPWEKTSASYTSFPQHWYDCLREAPCILFVFVFHTPFCSCPVCPLVSLLHQALTHQRALLSQAGSSPAAPARSSPNGISVPSEELMGTAGSSSSVLACARRPAKEASAIHRLCSARLVASAAHGARCPALARASRRRNADAPLLIRPPTSMPSTTKRHLAHPAPRVQEEFRVRAVFARLAVARPFATG